MTTNNASLRGQSQNHSRQAHVLSFPLIPLAPSEWMVSFSVSEQRGPRLEIRGIVENENIWAARFSLLRLGMFLELFGVEGQPKGKPSNGHVLASI